MKTKSTNRQNCKLIRNMFLKRTKCRSELQVYQKSGNKSHREIRKGETGTTRKSEHKKTRVNLSQAEWNQRITRITCRDAIIIPPHKVLVNKDYRSRQEDQIYQKIINIGRPVLLVDLSYRYNGLNPLPDSPWS
jgi:hypothetical protein